MTAVFSQDRRYRYRLERQLQGGLLEAHGAPGGTCLFVMLNPSTADEAVDDPTVTRCRGFASRWGYSQLVICNLFALRATDPTLLLVDRAPVSEDQADAPQLPTRNDGELHRAAREADRIVVAWGNTHWTVPLVRQRISEVVPILRRHGQLWCIGRTVDGSPRHPSRLGYANTLKPWTGPDPR